jgi:hypothetical protein
LTTTARNGYNRNILDNACEGGGRQLSLVCKQATLRPAQ